MEWTKEKQIDTDDIYIGKRVWAWYLDFSPMYRKTKYLVPPSEFFIATNGYRLESPFKMDSSGYDSIYLSRYSLGLSSGIFETQEDATYCWNEALDSTIKDIEEEASWYKHQVLCGDMEYRFTKNWRSAPKEDLRFKTMSEKEIFKEGIGKYYVTTSDPWWRKMYIPWTIRYSTRNLNGGTFPIYVGKHLVYRDSPKSLVTEFFPSYQDVALYYSNIGKYEIVNQIDEWKEHLKENVRKFKI